MPTRFGQLVVGAPGAGKTTYCEGMRQYLSALGRDPIVINLDPATTGKNFDIDITELVSIEGVMSELKLGPNGAMIYCLEYLNENVDWLLKKLQELEPNKYLIFDFPGQLELFTHCSSVLDIMKELTKLNYRLTVVNLIDAHHCSDPSKFIAASLLSLTIMVRLEMPHINVLSKIDLMNQFGILPMNLEFFTDLQDMPRLLMFLDAPPANIDSEEGEEEEDQDENDTNKKAAATEEEEEEEEEQGGGGELSSSLINENQQCKNDHEMFLIKRKRLHSAMCDLIEDFSLVSFETLDISSAESVGRILSKCDKANGYVYNANESLSNHEGQGQETKYASSLFSAISTDTEMFAERTLLVQEKYGKNMKPDSM